MQTHARGFGGRAQLVRQVAAESLVFASLGALTALPAAFRTLESIRVLLPPTLHGVERIALDGRIVAATAGLAHAVPNPRAVVLCYPED